MGSSPTPPAPVQRDYYKETADTLKAKVDLAPKVYESELKYQPLYNKLQLEQNALTAQGYLDLSKKLYPQIAELEAQYTEDNRRNELRGLQETLPQYTQAMDQLTPGYSQAVGNAGALAEQAMGEALIRPDFTSYEQAVGGPQATGDLARVQGPQDAGNMAKVGGIQMESGLNQINQDSVNQYLGMQPGMKDYANFLAINARNELMAGKGLTPEEQRLADQSARSAYAARGMSLGNQSMAAELLNRAEVSNQRYQQRLANAQSAAGQIQGIYAPALAQSLARQQGAEQYNIGAQGQAFAQANAKDLFAQQLQQEQFQQAMAREQYAQQLQQTALSQAFNRNAADMQRQQAGLQMQQGRAQLGAGAMSLLQAAQAPALNAFYKQPLFSGMGAQAAQMGLANQQMAGPALFNPESSYAGGLYASNAASQNAANLAQYQQQGASRNATMGMIGKVVGGVAGSFLGPVGTAAGSYLGGQIFGGGMDGFQRTFGRNASPEG